ncbi:AraC family transcriptional regulator [Neptunicella sp. SCSIO 80796]|uniref:AraC family transcriptional regulator n=1 Tax=Neptunicella plasticusilytica TaxID=3117012 RepID=UPI003A4E1D73
MTDCHLNQYQQRFIKVCEYIEQHLDNKLSVEHLSQVAHFSRWHFHRQFSEFTGFTVKRFIQQLRLKRASYHLIFRQDKIIDIALQAGFENPESFSRSFKKACGQTPSEFRKAPQWQPWQKHSYFTPIKDNATMSVKIIDFPLTHIAVFEHKGPHQDIYQSVQQFIQWRKANNFRPDKTRTYNIFYHDPKEVEPAEYRLDICVASDSDISPNEQGVVPKTIPANRCAYLRHYGSWDDLEESMRYLYAQWLPESGETPSEFPCFVERVNLYPEVAESELITDIYLPLK